MNSPSQALAYQIKRSAKRRQLCIQVKQSTLHVLAPLNLPSDAIEQFIESKRAWITRKLAQQAIQQQQLQDPFGRPFILIEGLRRAVDFTRGNKAQVTLCDELLTVQTPNRVLDANLTQYRRRQLDKWFATTASQQLPQRLLYWCERTGLTPSDLQIKKYKSRWGSCNQRGVISLNSLLLMTPASVVDYVIVHELCHLIHMNHSNVFWQLVQHHFPESHHAKAWLRQHASILNSVHAL
ncbi:MAG: M48 family metallopeptidase [Pseudomonadales bacterium]